MTKKRERKKDLIERCKRNIKREKCNGHYCNILLSHLGRERWIGPCGLTRIIDF
jgi:hypothetical protein